MEEATVLLWAAAAVGGVAAGDGADGRKVLGCWRWWTLVMGVDGAWCCLGVIRRTRGAWGSCHGRRSGWLWVVGRKQICCQVERWQCDGRWWRTPAVARSGGATDGGGLLLDADRWQGRAMGGSWSWPDLWASPAAVDGEDGGGMGRLQVLVDARGCGRRWVVVVSERDVESGC
ncbi:hypothetical protein ACLOJK_004297 [Asimina triloba]